MIESLETLQEIVEQLSKGEVNEEEIRKDDLRRLLLFIIGTIEHLIYDIQNIKSVI